MLHNKSIYLLQGKLHNGQHSLMLAQGLWQTTHVLSVLCHPQDRSEALLRSEVIDTHLRDHFAEND